MRGHNLCFYAKFTKIFLELYTKILPYLQLSYLELTIPEMKITEFTNMVDLDEATHNEPSYLDLYCLPSCLLISQYDTQ